MRRTLVKRFTILPVAFFAATLMILGVLSIQSAYAEKMDKLQIVQFHADWCGGCKIMGPWVEEAKGKYSNLEAVEFVKLDFTNRRTSNKAFEIASTQNLDDVFLKYQKRTGLVLIVDKDQNVVSEISYKAGKDAFFEKIEKALPAT